MSPSNPPACKIPVVDLGGLGDLGGDEDAGEAEWQRVAKELYEALSKVGFVYLSNHGISDEQISKFFKASLDFFRLPEKTKASYERDLSNSHGYNSIDRERLDKEKDFVELRESYQVKDLNGAYPDGEVPEFGPSAAALGASCIALVRRVLDALSLGLGLERDFFKPSYRHMYDGTNKNSSVFRINHYPPLPADVPENTIRCGAHTDYGSITLLFQDDMGGLQARGMDGEWVDVSPIPGTIVVNAGDLLQIWTANRVKATEHRVIIPKENVRQKVSRLSVAFFVHPDDEVMVRPIDGSTFPPPINARQHLLNMYAKTYKY